MVEFATKRVAERGLSHRISTQQADAQSLTSFKVRFVGSSRCSRRKDLHALKYRMDKDFDGQESTALANVPALTYNRTRRTGAWSATHVPSRECSRLELFENLLHLESAQRLLSYSLYHQRFSHYGGSVSAKHAI